LQCNHIFFQDYHHQHFLNDKLPRVDTLRSASRREVEIQEIICGIDCTKRYLSAELGQLKGRPRKPNPRLMFVFKMTYLKKERRGESVEGG